ncbi:helix-turn-helix transcriptional regulator [Paenibacillus sp. SAFN-117]|uniref:helix-turn-helix transcriptional regulator n=1 Tax=Paenibacillus sp. SAFN-117 TaxID=3436860 RepID=UPI003F7D47B5
MSLNYSKNLSEQISKLRRQRGMTQEQLANRLGVSYQAVSKWENEQSCPEITLLPLLADLFEITLDDLFGRKGNAVNISV